MRKRAAVFVPLTVVAAMAVTWAELQAFWPKGTVYAGWAPRIVIALSCTAVCAPALIFVRRAAQRDRQQKHMRDDGNN
jgi:hypothetical protein